MKRKNVLVFGLVSILLVLLTVVACTGPAPATTPAPSPTPALAPAAAPAPTPAPAPAVKPGEVITWKLYDDMLAGSTWWATPETVKEFQKRVLDGTKGRLKIEWVFSGEHPYTITQTLRPIKAGQCDLAMAGSLNAGDEPLLSSMSLSGFLFLVPKGDYAYQKKLIRWIAEQGFFDEALDKWNGKYLIGANQGGQGIFMKKTPVITPDSLKGKKIRVPSPETSDLIKLMGGEPVYVVWGECFTALSTGMVDGLYTSYSSAWGAGLAQLCPYVCWLLPSWSNQMLVANKNSLAALPPDVREDLIVTLKGLEDWWMDGANIDGLKVLERAIFEIGGQVSTISPEWRKDIRAQAFEKIWKPAIDKSGARGWEIWDKLAEKVIADGNDVPGYTLK